MADRPPSDKPPPDTPPPAADKPPDDGADELSPDAKRMLDQFGKVVDSKVNTILDQRLQVQREDDDDDDRGGGGGDKDEPPEPESIAAKLGFR